MKQKIFGVLQRVGRSFMLPIALLPVAGLLLGIGSSFTNPTTLEAFKLTGVIYEGGILYTVLDIMSKTGSVVFDNLALLNQNLHSAAVLQQGFDLLLHFLRDYRSHRHSLPS